MSFLGGIYEQILHTTNVSSVAQKDLSTKKRRSQCSFPTNEKYKQHQCNCSFKWRTSSHMHRNPMSSKHVSYILTFNIAEKTLFISKIGSSSILDFARQAICSSGLTKIAPLSVIWHMLHHENEFDDFLASATSI